MTFLRALAAPFTDAYDAWTGTDWLTCACRAATEPTRYVPADSPSLVLKTPAGGHAPDAVVLSGSAEREVPAAPARRSGLGGWLAA